MPIHGSDHGPIGLNLAPRSFVKKRLFRFEAMWLHNPSFTDLVNQVWNNSASGTPLQIYNTYAG